MQRAEKPAVNDLVHAVSNLNATMHKEVTSFLNENFPPPGLVSGHDAADRSNTGLASVTKGTCTFILKSCTLITNCN